MTSNSVKGSSYITKIQVTNLDAINSLTPEGGALTVNGVTSVNPTLVVNGSVLATSIMNCTNMNASQSVSAASAGITGALSCASAAITGALSCDSLTIGSGSSTTGSLSCNQLTNSGDYIGVIDVDSNATSNKNIAIGYGSTNSGTSSLAIGNGAASASRTIALGEGANAVADSTCAMGKDSKANAQYAVAIGRDAEAGNSSSVAIGYDAEAIGINSIAIGDVVASNTSAIALGNLTSASGSHSVAIGATSVASAVETTAIGNNAKAEHARSTAIGHDAISSDTDQIVLGISSTTVVAPGPVSITGATSMSGLATLTGGLSVSNNLNSNPELSVTGVLSVTGDVSVSNAATISGALTATGGLTSSSTTTVTGAMTASDSLTVSKATDPASAMEVTGTLKVNSHSDASGYIPYFSGDNVFHIQRKGNGASYSSYVEHTFYTGSTSGAETGTRAVLINNYGLQYTGMTIPSGSTPNTIGFRWSSPFINAAVDNVVYGNIATSSDRRLKANIKSYETGYDDIDKLTPKCFQPIKNVDISKCERCEDGKMKICDSSGVELLYDSSHNYVGDESILNLGEQMIGFVADEVQPHFPDLVCGEGEDLKSVTYANFTPILLGCLKTMKAKIEVLIEEIAILKASNAKQR